MSAAPQLVVTSKPMAGASFNIPDGYTEIGSLHVSAIRLDADGVSRRHASLDRVGDQVVLNDLGSRNGTWVNGQKITRTYVLRAGDRLQLGLVELRFLHSAAPRPAPAPPPTYGFGDVHGPVNAGHGTQNVGGYHQIAGRDIYGGTGHQVVNHELQADLNILRQVLAELKLTSAERQSAERELSAVENTIRSEEPDKKQAGQHLQTLVSGLEQAGALADAGVTLIEAAGRIASWLGPFGYTVLALLGL